MKCKTPWLFWISLLLALCMGQLAEPVAADKIPWRFPPAKRIVAIGDLHGDLAAARRALKLAGAIDDQDHWIGGSLVVVQTGDVLDRGDDELEVMNLFTRLAEEAARAGGAVHALNGNHELMNADLDLRNVTPGGFKDFKNALIIYELDSLLLHFEEGKRARAAAFRPGGKYARVLAQRNTVITIGQNVFVHGGILPEHLDYGLERLNTEIRLWLAGEQPCPKWILQRGSPLWTSAYSDDVGEDDCEMLASVLGKLMARRMIVGHTIHEDGITPYCNGKVWCIDTGMSAYYGGETQAIEIVGDSIRILAEY